MLEEDDDMTDVLIPRSTQRERDGGETAAPARDAVPARPRLSFLEPSSMVPTYVGIVVVAVGFALIAIGWAKVAALTNVALQLPYLVSAGITGLALVMCGLIIVNVAAKRQDAAERARQMQQLTGVLAELKDALGATGEDGE
jgi:hypothetical protein